MFPRILSLNFPKPAPCFSSFWEERRKKIRIDVKTMKTLREYEWVDEWIDR